MSAVHAVEIADRQSTRDAFGGPRYPAEDLHTTFEGPVEERSIIRTRSVFLVFSGT